MQFINDSDVYINYLNLIKINSDISFFKDKTFLISGASGLIGSHLIDFLSYVNDKNCLNIKVYGIFSSKESFFSRFSVHSKETSGWFHPIICNMQESNFDINIQINEKIDYVIHLASQTHPFAYNQYPTNTISLNCFSTYYLLLLAKKYNAKFIFLSTFEVYGKVELTEKVNEKYLGTLDFNVVRSCYPESKRMAENMCISFASQYNVNYVILRVGYVFGPTVKLTSSKADVQFLKQAIQKKDIILQSRGNIKRSYIFVSDVVHSILFSLKEDIKKEIFNVSDELGDISLYEFAEILSSISGSKINVLNNVPEKNLSLHSLLDSSKIKQIGWYPIDLPLVQKIKDTFNILVSLYNKREIIVKSKY